MDGNISVNRKTPLIEIGQKVFTEGQFSSMKLIYPSGWYRNNGGKKFGTKWTNTNGEQLSLYNNYIWREYLAPKKDIPREVIISVPTEGQGPSVEE